MSSILKSPVLASPHALVKGEIWKIGERHIKIGHVGRLLVHYRNVDPLMKRISRESLESITTLQRHLATNNAVLMTEA